MIKKLWATKEIYEIVSRTVRERKASGKCYNDTLQLLLDSGDEELVVIGVSVVSLLDFFSIMTGRLCIQFIMGLLIAGARATGTTGKFSLKFTGLFFITQFSSIVAFHFPWGTSELALQGCSRSRVTGRQIFMLPHQKHGARERLSAAKLSL